MGNQTGHDNPARPTRPAQSSIDLFLLLLLSVFFCFVLSETESRVWCRSLVQMVLVPPPPPPAYPVYSEQCCWYGCTVLTIIQPAVCHVHGLLAVPVSFSSIYHVLLKTKTKKTQIIRFISLNCPLELIFCSTIFE